MDRVIIHVRPYRKAVEIRYVDADTGEVIYNMEMYDIVNTKLLDVIRGIETMNGDRFDGVQISWDVSYSE